jgi:hypothetical protein
MSAEFGLHYNVGTLYVTGGEYDLYSEAARAATPSRHGKHVLLNIPEALLSETLASLVASLSIEGAVVTSSFTPSSFANAHLIITVEDPDFLSLLIFAPAHSPVVLLNPSFRSSEELADLFPSRRFLKMPMRHATHAQLLRALDTVSKHVVISRVPASTTLLDYDDFIQPLRRVFAHDVVLLHSSQPSREIANYCSENNAKIRLVSDGGGSSDNDDDDGDYNTLFDVYADLCAHFEHCLVTPFDTFFQTNPFDKVLVTTDVVFSLEAAGDADLKSNLAMKIGSGAQLSEAVEACYGREALLLIQDQPIVSAAVMGTPRGFRALSDAMDSNYCDDDLAAIQYFVHGGELVETRHHVQPQGGGIVNSLKYLPRPKIADWTNPLGLIMNDDADATPAAVVVGYKAFPETRGIIDALKVTARPPPPPLASISPPADYSCKLTAIIGIFTTSSPKNEENEALFKLWLPVVGPSNQLKCGLNFVFVYGTPAIPAPGRMILDIKENMNEGKSLQFFKEATLAFPEADYVYKMDTDIGLCLPDLLSLLHKASEANADYVGWRQNFVSCGMQPRCPPYGEAEDWFFNSGSFYGMKRTVASLVAASQVNARKNVGDEDLMMGRMVHRVLPIVAGFDLACLFDREDYVDPDTNEVWHGKMVDAQSTTCPLRHFQTLRFPDRNTAALKSICTRVGEDEELLYYLYNPMRAPWEPAWAVN